jgi:hypothetical protein
LIPGAAEIGRFPCRRPCYLRAMPRGPKGEKRSNSEANEVPPVLDCFRKLTTMSWYDLMTSGTRDKSRKTGMNYETFAWNQVGESRPSAVSPDIDKVASVRAGGKYRIFGIVEGGRFYVLWFDRSHTIVR